MCICCNVWVQALTRAHAHTFSAIIGNEQQQYLTSLTLFLMWYWRCDFNPLFNHLTIKSLPYWSAKGLLLLQKVVWFWSFFWKFLYTFNSLYPATGIWEKYYLNLIWPQSKSKLNWTFDKCTRWWCDKIVAQIFDLLSLSWFLFWVSVRVGRK